MGDLGGLSTSESHVKFVSSTSTKKKKDAKNAGVVQGVLRMTTDTTDDMVLALERYLGDGDGGYSHASHSSRFFLCRA